MKINKSEPSVHKIPLHVNTLYQALGSLFSAFSRNLLGIIMCNSVTIFFYENNFLLIIVLDTTFPEITILQETIYYRLVNLPLLIICIWIIFYIMICKKFLHYIIMPPSQGDLSHTLQAKFWRFTYFKLNVYLIQWLFRITWYLISLNQIIIWFDFVRIKT